MELRPLDIDGDHVADAARREQSASPFRLLTRHFLRRLLDNDLISPNADRHETLVVGATLLISGGLFIAVLITSKYLMDPFPTPVRTVLGGIDDRFLLIALSMVVMALVAAAQWDALSIDARDAAILGPLPVGHGAILAAKLAALAIFTAVFVVIMNAGETVLFPLFLAARLPVGLLDIATLLVAHAFVTLAAGGFGVACVVLIREGLRACLGARLFNRVSTMVQALLVVACVTTLLLLPGAASRSVRASLDNPTLAVEWLPPLWFVGVHEVIAGHVIARIPSASRHQPGIREYRPPAVILAREREAAALYQRNLPRFRLQAQTAAPVFAAVIVAALAAFAWNNRRLPGGLPVRAARRSRWRRAVAHAVERWVVPAPAAQAGFFFTLQVLPRSAAHRVGIASAIAAGLATLLIAFSGVAFTHLDGPPARAGVWAAQNLLLVAVLAGVRHAVRVPAELRASASFLIAWPGEDRAYLAGVKRAALAALALPIIALMLPLHVVLLGRDLALLHALCGFALAVTLLEALLHGIRHPPFVCAYVPGGSFKRAAPIYLVGLVTGCYLFAALERTAFTSRTGSAVLFAALGLTTMFLRWRDRASRHEAPDLEIDLAPDAAVTMDLRS